MLLISEAQADIRRVYEGGFYGPLVSAAVWLAAAALGTWVSTEAGIMSLMVGGALIFPLTTLVLKVAGRGVALPSGHSMAPLATQVAFTVPIGLVVELGATAHRTDGFFPAALLIVGGALPAVRVLLRDAVVRRFGRPDDIRRSRAGAVGGGPFRYRRLAGGGSPGGVRLSAAFGASPDGPVGRRYEGTEPSRIHIA